MVLLAGCATKERISFNDETSAHAVAIVSVPVKKLEKADQLEIEQVVFSNLLERHFWDLADYSATFLQADDAQVTELIKKFPNHIPAIKPAYRAELSGNRAPHDKDTGRPAMILSVVVNDPNADDSVDALGRWFAGEAVSGFYTFHLTKTGEGWTVESVR